VKTPPAILLCAVAALAACRDDAPPPSPVPPATTSGDPGLRPLTSRDGGAPAGPAGGNAAALPPGHPPIAGGSAAASADALGVSGRVVVSARLEAQVPPRHALFLIARDEKRTIVAVRREEGVRYPFAFRITAADAMTEGTQFAGPLEITARISKTGDAIPQAGDLEGVVRGVAVGASDVPITIDTPRK
jgi:cytochrome c-type biogenesis protein CcmH